MKKLLLLAALFCALPALAQKAPRDMLEIKEGAAVTLKPDKAYILFRTEKPKGTATIHPVFLRVPSSQEMARFAEAKQQAFRAAEPRLIKDREKILAEQAKAKASGKPFRKSVPPVPSIDNFSFNWDAVANLQNIDDDVAFVKGAGGSVYLVEAPPGEYILYGASFSGILRPGLHVCFCLGTVGFQAKAGQITDMGHFLGDQVKSLSNIPELAPESNFGPSSDPFFPLIGGTVRPARGDAAIPAALRGMPIAPAGYRAIGKYFHPGAMGINRLVPVPGVLAYDRGKVIDVKSNSVAPDRH